MFTTPEQLNDVRTIVRQLSKANVDESAIEIEIRFGIFSTQNFINGVSREVFDRVRNFLMRESQRLKVTQNAYIHSEDKIFQEFPKVPDQPRRTERYTTVFNEQGLPDNQFQTIKGRYLNLDILDYFFRISVSYEITLTPEWPKTQPIYVREKKRWSYTLNQAQFRIDLTEVTSYRPSQTRGETVYEIEVEILPPKLVNLGKINDLIQFFLPLILDTPLIYSNTEKLGVIDRINQYLGSRVNAPGEIDFRPLSQVRNIKVRDMVHGGLVPKTNHDTRYSVTIKADGIRKLLVIDSEGIYLVYPPAQIMKILPREIAAKLSGWIGTVIEGELIPKQNLSETAEAQIRNTDVYFLMFDTLAISRTAGVREHRGTLIRNESHPVRREYIEKIELIFNGMSRFQIKAKEFHILISVSEYYQKVNRILDSEWPFQTDGLIFTPSNYRYDTGLFRIPLSERSLSRYPDIVKWKPQTKLTVDFEIQHVASPDGNYIELYSKGPPLRDASGRVIRDAFGKIKPNLLRFDDFARPPFNSQENVIITDIIRTLPSGTIVEFEWIEEGGFQATRIRDDKTEPNRRDVAQDVWEDIHRPIDEATMRGSRFSLVFRYHNRVKRRLIQDAAKSLPKLLPGQTRTLLSIGAGRGGDVNKWIQSGFTHIIAVEPDNQNRAELDRRLQATQLQYIIIPTTGQDVNQIVQQVQTFAPQQKVDVVEYMLSLSFFFDLPESMASIPNLINQTLLVGGYFIALTIDGRYVLELFSNPAHYEEVNEVKRARFRMIDFELRPPDPLTGNPQHVYVHIPDSIVQNQIEYLADISELVKALQNIGLSTISEERVDREKFLTQEELVYTRLFTRIIMRRER